MTRKAERAVIDAAKVYCDLKQRVQATGSYDDMFDGIIELVDAQAQLLAAVTALNNIESASSGPKTVNQLSVRAIRGLDGANGYQWPANRDRFKRLRTAKAVFRAGYKLLRRQPSIGEKTMSEFASVLSASGFNVTEWRAR